MALKKAGLPLERLAPSIAYNKSHFNLSEDAFVYFCPQSVFKMHPLFDTVFRDILLANPEGHVVITGGRRPSWTDTYMTRLRLALGDRAMKRLHLIDRVSAEKFLALLKIADVILHPFPFDGSRTSADGLIAGVPVLTMPTGNGSPLSARSTLSRTTIFADINLNSYLPQSISGAAWAPPFCVP